MLSHTFITNNSNSFLGKLFIKVVKKLISYYQNYETQLNKDCERYAQSQDYNNFLRTFKLQMRHSQYIGLDFQFPKIYFPVFRKNPEFFSILIQTCHQQLENENTNACSFLGLCNQFGCGIEKNLNEACRLYIICYKTNDFSTLYYLSKCLFELKNVDEGKFYLQEGINKNDTLCYEYYGDLVFEGKFFSQNNNLSKKFYDQASSLGSRSAKRKSANLFHNIPKSTFTYIFNIILSIIQGNVHSLFDFGHYINRVFLVQRDNSLGNLMMITAADLNDDVACLEYGQFLIFKNQQSILDRKNGFIYTQKSADLGNDIACFLCGIYYKNGYGTIQNNSLAFYYFLLGTDFDNSRSRFELANCYLYGIGVSIDIQHSISLLQINLKEHEPESLVLFGLFSKFGIYIEIDENQAVEYFKQAYFMKSPKGAFWYGLCLTEGAGIKKNKIEGFNVLVESANHKFLLSEIFLSSLVLDHTSFHY